MDPLNLFGYRNNRDIIYNLYVYLQIWSTHLIYICLLHYNLFCKQEALKSTAITMLPYLL